MEKLKQLGEKFREFWTPLKRWQKFSIIGTSAAVFLSLIALVFISGGTSYEPLFVGLEVSDQASIVSYLKENKIPYRSDSVSNAILVPRDVVYDTRLALSEQGLPKGGVVGFEIFDSQKMGMSDFQQKVAYSRALEGELSRTIQKISVVDTARVSIVIPEQRLFLEQQQPSTASVLVGLEPGQTIKQEHVKGIVNLVARSVSGLNPADVTVVDTTGRVLSDMIADDSLIYGGDGSAVSSVQRELERQQEKELEQKVKVMMEKVFGQGKAVVRVRMELDFDQRKWSQKEFIPGASGRGVVRSQQNMEENYTGPGTPLGGVPGTTTNIPGYVVNTAQAGNVEYNKSDTVTNYDITTHESQQVATPGSIKRLSASVLVDGTLTPEQNAELVASVGAAIGLNNTRGDQLVIQGMRFDTTLADKMLAELQAEQRKKAIIAIGIALILLLILGAGGYLYYRRRKIAAMMSAVDGEDVPSLKDLLANPELMTSQGEMAVLEEQLKVYATNNPEEVANLIKNWLAEDI